MGQTGRRRELVETFEMTTGQGGGFASLGVWKEGFISGNLNAGMGEQKQRQTINLFKGAGYCVSGHEARKDSQCWAA